MIECLTYIGKGGYMHGVDVPEGLNSKEGLTIVRLAIFSPGDTACDPGTIGSVSFMREGTMVGNGANLIWNTYGKERGIEDYWSRAYRAVITLAILERVYIRDDGTIWEAEVKDLNNAGGNFVHSALALYGEDAQMSLITTVVEFE